MTPQILHRGPESPQWMKRLISGEEPDLNRYLHHRQLAAKSELWHEGDSGNFLALIVSGRLELLKSTAFPGRPFVLGLFGAGSLVGEESFLEAQPRQGTVRALEETELLILQRENFAQLDKEHPQQANLLLQWVLNLLSVRLRSTQDRLAAIF